MGIQGKNKMVFAAMAGGIAVALIMIIGTVWIGRDASQSTINAVRSVSLLYLNELAERRKKVAEDVLNNNFLRLKVATNMMGEDDLKDIEHLQAFQKRMKKLFKLDKFAFVDTNGLIYTALGTQMDIDKYAFNHRTISGPEISIKNMENDEEREVVFAMPVDIPFNGETFKICFMEMHMKEMLAGVSMTSQEENVTFSNVYSLDGYALSNLVLGGKASENNLFEAMNHAVLEKGYSLEKMRQDFKDGKKGVISFVYDGVEQTMCYIPIKGTDWLLTYLIHENVISNRIIGINKKLIRESAILSILNALVLLGIFIYIMRQNKANARLLLEKETSEAELRGKQAELGERIALQEKLVQQSQALSDALTAAEEANKAKTAFLSNMSHEIRTPMNAIIGLDNIALNDPGTPPKIKGYLSKIGDSAHHLLDLINDILDMSRIESGRLILKNEEFPFAKLIENINTIFSGQCQEKGLDYQCHVNGHIDDYYIGDNMKLRQVLINILGNAVKFTPQGGKVELKVERTAVLDDKSTLRFTIEDTGIGMNKDFLPHIFDVFSQEDSSTTNKYGSSGLGLAITKNIVEMMNGNIQVDSTKGKGSVFTVTVTLMNSQRNGSEEDVKINPQDMSVLIVDDDTIAIQHATLVLEKIGIAAESASSGQEAIEMVKLRHARRQPYNLILVDWQMPEMDGVETTRQIRAIVGHESAIIILTAYRWDDILEEAIEAGIDSFISKPLFASALMDEFQTALKKKKAMFDDNVTKADLKGRRILLAEDVEINAEIMIMVLETREMEADLAKNGKIAVEMFESHPEGYYDAILMDMRMPEMDGLTATKIIRAMDRADAKEIPIIALTANAFDEDVQRSMQAGLNAHLSKPVEPENLYETLESLIKS
ncbi:MAG: response regulator [Victivallales bacterium]|nr:response regulator [Victivallales bacterium]